MATIFVSIGWELGLGRDDGVRFKTYSSTNSVAGSHTYQVILILSFSVLFVLNYFILFGISSGEDLWQDFWLQWMSFPILANCRAYSISMNQFDLYQNLITLQILREEGIHFQPTITYAGIYGFTAKATDLRNQKQRKASSYHSSGQL